MTAIDTMKDQLAKMRSQHEQLNTLLKLSRENVVDWLQILSNAALCEIGHLERPENGDIADGDLHSTYKLLQEAIKDLRDTQEAVKTCVDNIAEIERDIEYAIEEADHAA
jgi:predicted DNA-binding ArsR family transcriptional regulator